MLKLFNSFQIVGFFAAYPFLVGWLFTAEFAWHTAAAWASLAGYIAYFAFMVAAVLSAIERD